MFLKSDEESDTKNNTTEKGKGFPKEQESLVTKMRRFSVSQLQVIQNHSSKRLTAIRFFNQDKESSNTSPRKEAKSYPEQTPKHSSTDKLKTFFVSKENKLKK